MRYLTALLAACLSVASFAFDVPCLDPLACNFMEEGECFFTDENGDPCVIEGCTIEGACNFDPEADLYDGSCEFVSCLGCTDSEACNYDETALYDDATCIYYVDCNGTCGGDWIEDACGNCYNPNIGEIQFDYVGSSVTWTVPEGVFMIDVELWGAQGGNGGPSTAGIGGKGGYVTGSIEVMPGTQLFVYVGGKGEDYSLNSPTGGFNGGGGTNATSDDNKRPGCGGGASDIRIGGIELYNRVVVAGGGGGSGGWLSSDGGNAGGDQGEQGNPPYHLEEPGQGGSQVAGGSAGGNAEDGSLGFGGMGQGYSHGGGGGGGGFYGGGGGYVDAGGGGSSFVGDLVNPHTEGGVRSGHGLIIISWGADPYCNPGCTYPQACNYNPESNFDDGSCDYCFCGEGTQWVDSLQACMVTEAALMQACGEGTYWDDLAQACLTIETCQEDLDGDGIVGINDLLELLSSFGSECVIEPETAEWTCGDPVNYHGYDYATVQIGEQCWFAEDLRTQNFADGTPISDLYNPEGWYFDPTESCAFDCGLLYSLQAIQNPKSLCPNNYHVGTWADFETLFAAFGGEGTAAPFLQIEGWGWATNTSGIGFNPSGTSFFSTGFDPEDIIHSSPDQSWIRTSTLNGSNGMSFVTYENYSAIDVAPQHNPNSTGAVRCIKDSE